MLDATDNFIDMLFDIFVLCGIVLFKRGASRKAMIEWNMSKLVDGGNVRSRGKVETVALRLTSASAFVITANQQFNLVTAFSVTRSTLPNIALAFQFVYLTYVLEIRINQHI